MRVALRSHHLAGLLALATSCGGGDGKAQDAGIDVGLPDAPESMPTLTSFSPSPMQVPAGVATAVTWNWTYLVDPPIPPPTCTINNGVGEVTRGESTLVTLTQTTTFRLTCSNRAGMTSRDTVVTIPNAPPTLATFTATPSALAPNTATTVTFNWTYSTVPSPAPTCTIDAGIGTATPGITAQLTLPQARTFRLRCTSTQGTSMRDVTVGVNECAAGTHECDANASCSDATEPYTCTCNSGYSGNGAVCSATNLACSTPGVCAQNAQCVSGNTCVCDPGYVGDGLTCTRLRLTFVTSTSYNGNLGGLAGADAACQSHADNAGLPGTYVAWLSDATSDAYCRVHGLSGKKVDLCGQGALPATAGPWVRTDTQRLPAAPAIDKLLAPTRQTLYPVTRDEAGIEVTSSPLLVWTGTDDTGVLTGTACSNWTSADGGGAIRGAVGDISGGGTSWTDQGADPTCSVSARLRCVEVAAGSGPALPSRYRANAKRAFVTSVSGTGMLSSWPDAGGSTGILAADAICQARARFAGYTTASSFKAIAGYSSLGASRIVNASVPWYRPDGVQIAANEADLLDARLLAPLYQTELGAYAPGTAETGSVWTGTTATGGFSSSHCSNWSSTASSAVVGRFDVSDFRWLAVSSPATASCSATDYRLYCLDDSP